MRSILLALTLLGGCVEPLEPTETTESAVQRENGRRARIASSGFSSCAIRSDGRVKCFGDNTSGQLGDGTRVSRSSPVLVQNLDDVIDIAMTPSRALALASDGTVWQWGALESGVATTPQQVAGLTDVVEVMGGGSSPCILRSNGTVACWGLLPGTITSTAIPTTVSGLTNVASLAKGSAHCAVLLNGTVKCWGVNNYGQLGNGTLTTSTTPVTVSGISSAIAVAGGPYHACALLAGGTIKCWGRNHRGQLGNGTTSSFSSTPVAVGYIATAKAIAVGQLHSCAVLASGAGRCWGLGSNGQLGDGNDAAYSTPRVVEDLANAVELASDTDTTTALVADGSLRAWGRGEYGALGDGGTPETLVPVVVAGSDRYGGLRVSTGTSAACALLPSGRVKCWGDNSRGQLGNGTTTDSVTPVYFGSLTNVVDVASDEFATCALRGDGTVWCAGHNIYVDSTTPVQIAGIANAVTLDSYAGTVCALLALGTVKCFGIENHGGDSETPTTVPGWTDAISIDVGTDFKCAIRAGGTAQCVGANRWGQLGNGSTIASEDTPVTVRTSALSPLTNVVALSAGGARACAVLASGAVRCWGAGMNGLGTGSPMPTENPYAVAVAGITDAVDVSVGYDNMCALRRNGRIQCWGLGGNLGAGEPFGSDALAPLDVGGATPLTNATQMASSRGLTCAALADGTAACWGNNSHGQVGAGTTGGTINLPAAVVGL